MSAQQLDSFFGSDLAGFQLGESPQFVLRPSLQPLKVFFFFFRGGANFGLFFDLTLGPFSSRGGFSRNFSFHGPILTFEIGSP